MCTYNAISSHTDHYEIQKRDSEESLLTFVNLFPSYNNSGFWVRFGYGSHLKAKLFSASRLACLAR